MSTSEWNGLVMEELTLEELIKNAEVARKVGATCKKVCTRGKARGESVWKRQSGVQVTTSHEDERRDDRNTWIRMWGTS